VSFWKIAWRNIQQRALASSLTGLSMALGVALMILVLVIHQVVVDQLSNDAQGYHLIIGGGKGSKFDVVLSTVFHFGTALYPIPYEYYKEFVDGEYAPLVDVAVPVCLGDSFESEDGQLFRVVGTTPEMFDRLRYGVDDDGQDLRYRFRSGRNFKAENFFEAVVGSVTANRTGLKVGDRFRPTHGMSGEGEKHDEFEVVGVLAPTGTANDRALFVNVEGFYLLDGHALAPTDARTDTPTDDKIPPPQSPSRPDSPSESSSPPPSASQPPPLPEAQRQVTSVLVLCDEDQMMASMMIEKGVNKSLDGVAQAVAPTNVIERLKQGFLAPMKMILLVLTVLIVIVAGISILVSIYNSMSERSHDIAVMRALGASRTHVMGIILVESILLSTLAGIAGMLLGHAILAAASPLVEFYTGVTVRAWESSPQEWLLIPGLVAFAAAVGLLPAVTAYRTDVTKALG
jgi:putative ABC transport system permease protein